MSPPIQQAGLMLSLASFDELSKFAARFETAEGARKYKAINQEIKKSIKKAKEFWIDVQ